MLETLLWVIVGWAMGSFLLSLTARETSLSADTEDVDDLPPNAVVVMDIQLEEVKGWWYGWFHNSDGSETFIGQGTTYDEAINNCRERIREQHPDLKLKYNFEMKNANTTVQS